MRILVVSHPPLTREFGGAQSGMSLAKALRDRGHDAFSWSPAPILQPTRWSNYWSLQNRAIEHFARAEGPFDVIDTPAVSASATLANSANRLVVRSVQPELLYVASDLRAEWSRPTLPGLFRTLLRVVLAATIVRGWRRADVIACLGTLELEWMRSHFPSWRGKLRSYVCAPPSDERSQLALVREARVPDEERRGTRFLWIGRWAAHKGVETLRRFLMERGSSDPDDTVTIAGSGSSLEAELPAPLLRTGRIRVIPSFRRTELPKLLAEHDAGLFTSTVEGWGMSLNEMLESGLPVFATDAGAVADLRPFFPRSLFPFPPPARWARTLPLEDLNESGYLEWFSWPSIAGRYDHQVLQGESAR